MPHPHGWGLLLKRRNKMFKILKDKTICLTQGDVANIEISASLQDGKVYSF
jgi:hypothetical protein